MMQFAKYDPTQLARIFNAASLGLPECIVNPSHPVICSYPGLCPICTHIKRVKQLWLGVKYELHEPDRWADDGGRV